MGICYGMMAIENISSNEDTFCFDKSRITIVAAR